MLMVYGDDCDLDVEKIKSAIAPKIKGGVVTRSVNKNDKGVEIILEIKVKSEDLAIIDEIKAIDGVREVRYVSVSGETVG